MKATQFQINPTCNRCKLHESADRRSICLKGRHSDGRRKLLVFVDTPDFFANRAHRPFTLDVKDFLDWLFWSMSIDPESVGYEYTLRCYPGEDLPTTKAGRAVLIEECSIYRFAEISRIRPKAIAVLGQLSLEAFTGKTKIGEHEGRRIPCWEAVVRDHVSHVWASYSVNYCLVSPSDTGRVFRVLFRAAEEAGLKPVIDPTVSPFKWRNLL